jgi:mannose-6-phosphate isomerase-like protein (cupin superfamily)
MRASPVLVASLFLAIHASAAAQSGPGAATDITAEQVQTVLTAMIGESIDRPLKIVDMGNENFAVGILHRTGEHDTDGVHRGAIHTQLHEVYYILSGGGTLLTGGELSNATAPGPDEVVGPTFSADSRNGAVREISAGDIVIIPAGTLHAWLSIPDHVTYLGFRPDPGRVLPAGYVNPGID